MAKWLKHSTTRLLVWVPPCYRRFPFSPTSLLKLYPKKWVVYLQRWNSLHHILQRDCKAQSWDTGIQLLTLLATLHGGHSYREKIDIISRQAKPKKRAAPNLDYAVRSIIPIVGGLRPLLVMYALHASLSTSSSVHLLRQPFKLGSTMVWTSCATRYNSSNITTHTYTHTPLLSSARVGTSQIPRPTGSPHRCSEQEITSHSRDQRPRHPHSRGSQSQAKWNKLPATCSC